MSEKMELRRRASVEGRRKGRSMVPVLDTGSGMASYTHHLDFLPRRVSQVGEAPRRRLGRRRGRREGCREGALLCCCWVRRDLHPRPRLGAEKRLTGTDCENRQKTTNSNTTGTTLDGCLY